MFFVYKNHKILLKNKIAKMTYELIPKHRLTNLVMQRSVIYKCNKCKAVKNVISYFVCLHN